MGAYLIGTINYNLNFPGRGKGRVFTLPYGKNLFQATDVQNLGQLLDLIIDPQALFSRTALGIEPAAPDSRIVAALDIAGQGITHNQNLIRSIFPNLLKNPVEKLCSGFFHAHFLGNKNTVQQLVQDIKTDRDEQKAYIQELKEDRSHLRRDRDDLRKRQDELEESVRSLQREVARYGRMVANMRPFLCGRTNCPNRMLVTISADGETETENTQTS